MTAYTAVIEHCPDTKLYVGYVPGFPGAHSQGATLDELQANLREVIAMLLEDKRTIPAVKAQLELIQAMQDLEFWEGMTLAILEDVRVRLRGLVPFLDRHQRKLVYTDFKDELVGVRNKPQTRPAPRPNPAIPGWSPNRASAASV